MQKNELKKESPKLLPCPFCGGKARMQHYRNGDCAIECIECYGKTHRSATEDLAIRRWNTRKPIDRIVEQLEQQAEQYRRREIEAEQKGFSREAEKYYGKQWSYLHSIEIVKGDDENE